MLYKMVKTHFQVPDEGVRKFLEGYVDPLKRGEDTPKDIYFMNDACRTYFNFLTVDPITEPVFNSPIAFGKPVRSFPGPDYLGEFNLINNILRLDEENYNSGRPNDPRLVTGFRRLAKLFCLEIPVE